MNPPFLEVSGLSKTYGGVHALAEVGLTLAAGEIHALLGENGAGKSTFIKCLSGAVRPDGGTVQVDGIPLPPGDLRAAEAAGIVALHQESTAFPHLSAVDNIFVGREPRRALGLLDRRRMEREAKALLERLGETIDLRRPLEELPLAQRQMVGLARALSHRSRLLILDEPTASLSARETQTLFRILRQLQGEGVAVLYISHRLEEVYALASRVTVLRDGRLVGTYPLADIGRDELVRRMVGRELLSEERPDAPAEGAVLLDVRGLGRTGQFQDVSFSLRAGEIVGLAGLIGAGRSEVAGAIFGIETPTSGTVTVGGEALTPGSVPAALARGVALVPEDRQHQGLVLPLSVGQNLLLAVQGSLTAAGFRAPRREQAVVTDLMRDLAVKAAGPDVPASTLSGGNQQKLSLGKWLATKPRVLLLDEPTRGVDVGAKAEVYRLIRQLARDGMATLVISSDLPEILALSDRILVMREGQVAGEMPRAGATEEKILALALPGESAGAA
jgi:ABC-type sugar transport system ATPase subunit